MALIVVPDMPMTASGLGCAVATLTDVCAGGVDRPLGVLRRLAQADAPGLSQAEQIRRVVGRRDGDTGSWAVVVDDDPRCGLAVAVSPEGSVEADRYIISGFATAEAARNAAVYVSLTLHWPVLPEDGYPDK